MSKQTNETIGATLNDVARNLPTGSKVVITIDEDTTGVTHVAADGQEEDMQGASLTEMLQNVGA